MAKRSSTAKSKGLNASMRVILLRGPELFLHAEHTRELTSALREVHGEIEIFRFDGATATLAEVLDELRTYGLMQHYKLVILDNADQFLAGKKKSGDDEDAKEEASPNRAAMERYVEAPVDNATLLLRAETWRPGRIDKMIERVGTIQKCEPLSPKETEASAISRAQSEYNVALSSKAASELVKRVGTNLARVDAEIARLASYVGDNGTITPEIIRDLVEPSREEMAWVIQEAVLSGDPGHSLARLTELLEVSRQPKELIFWSVSDLLRKLYHASRMTRAGAHSSAMSRELRLWGPSGQMILTAARRIEPSRFAQLLHEALASDWRMKTGQRDGIRTLEGLVVRVADSVGTN